MLVLLGVHEYKLHGLKVIDVFEKVYGKAKEYTILNGQKEGARWIIDDKEINIQSRTNDYCANGVEQHAFIVKISKL